MSLRYIEHMRTWLRIIVLQFCQLDRDVQRIKQKSSRASLSWSDGFLVVCAIACSPALLNLTPPSASSSNTSTKITKSAVSASLDVRLFGKYCPENGGKRRRPLEKHRPQRPLIAEP